MAPQLAEAWSIRAHGTSTLNNEMILAQLLITEAGIAAATAYQLKTSLELANLKSELAILRHMLEAQTSSPSAPPSEPAAAHTSIAAITTDPEPYINRISNAPSPYIHPKVRCRGCKNELTYTCGHDKFLCEQIKNGTMRPRLTCFDCKKIYTRFTQG